MTFIPGYPLTVYHRACGAREDDFTPMTFESGLFGRKLEAAVKNGTGEITREHATICTATGVLVLLLIGENAGITN